MSAAARRQRFSHDHQVIYASGGWYCLSRAALNAIASHRCVERVAAIGANRSAGGEYSLRHEDAAVGACAHLVGARLDTSLGAVCMLRVRRREAYVGDCNGVTKPPPLGAHPVKPVGTRHGTVDAAVMYRTFFNRYRVGTFVWRNASQRR